MNDDKIMDLLLSDEQLMKKVVGEALDNIRKDPMKWEEFNKLVKDLDSDRFDKI